MISIIIPTYNSSVYLKRCLDSIVGQNYNDYEVLVVNDGSTDNTKEVLEEYTKKYPQIKPIHKENGGVSSARNRGLKEAKGAYLIFIDSDDCLQEGALSTINAHLEEGIDLYIYNNLILNKEGINECLNSSFSSINELILETVEPIQKNHNEWLRSIWAKVYRKEVLENIEFSTDFYIGEDACFLVDLIYKIGDISKIKMLSESFYVYDCTNELSATHKYKKNLYMMSRLQFDYLMKTIKNLKNFDEKYRDTVLAKFCFKLFWILYFQGQFVTDNDDCFKWYKDTAQYINKKDLYDIDFKNDLMNKSFRYRNLLNNKFIFNIMKRLYLSRNKKRNV